MVASNSTNKDIGVFGEFALGEFAQGSALVLQDSLGPVWSEPVRQKIDPRRAVALAASGLVETLLPEQGKLTGAWYQWFSEPVRFKKGLPTREQPVLAYIGAATQNAPNNNFSEQSIYSKYAFPWSEPVRVKPRLREGLQRFHTNDTVPFPAANIGWHVPFGLPVWPKKGIRPWYPPFLAYSYSKPIVSFAYYNALTIPVRVKPGLMAGLNQADFTPTFIPNPKNQAYIIT